MGNYISGYEIYQLDTLTLRGNIADPTQITPIGLNGGRLADAMEELFYEESMFTGYDASEGALYILFILTLAIYFKVPGMFAIDSFDHALNPRLAKRITEIFSKLIIENEKTVFMTTHNPLVCN